MLLQIYFEPKRNKIQMINLLNAQDFIRFKTLPNHNLIYTWSNYLIIIEFSLMENSF